MFLFQSLGNGHGTEPWCAPSAFIRVWVWMLDADVEKSACRVENFNYNYKRANPFTIHSAGSHRLFGNKLTCCMQTTGNHSNLKSEAVLWCSILFVTDFIQREPAACKNHWSACYSCVLFPKRGVKNMQSCDLFMFHVCADIGSGCKTIRTSL